MQLETRRHAWKSLRSWRVQPQPLVHHCLQVLELLRGLRVDILEGAEGTPDLVDQAPELVRMLEQEASGACQEGRYGLTPRDADDNNRAMFSHPSTVTEIEDRGSVRGNQLLTPVSTHGPSTPPSPPRHSEPCLPKG